MLTRLTHAAIAFAVTAVLYQAYVLAVVPFVEPAWLPEQVRESTLDGPFKPGTDSLDKYRALLAAYFPPTHWCFARPPKTLENGRILVVYDDFTQSESGEVRAPLCAVIFFPHIRDRAAPPPPGAIILESSGGAVLQMEQKLDAGVKGFGDIQTGQLQGEVTVRSDMREPGPEDDLRITTRDLYMNEDLIHTDQPVDLQLGQHHAFGRELEIRFLKTDRSPGDGAGALYGSFDDLVVKHDVSVTVAPGKLKFIGDAAAASSAATPQPAASGDQVAGPPVQIKSAGPFRIDFGSYKATFAEQVRAWQVHPDGKMDELLAAELTLFFTKTTRWNADEPQRAGAVGSAVGGDELAFEPASVEARGAPVLLKAPSHDATARGERLWVELAQGRLSQIVLEQGEEVVLTHQGAEIHARTLSYKLPPAGSGQRIGAMAARDGGGWLRAVPDAARPDQVVEVRWTDAMQLVRRDGQPVLVLDGRPRVSLTGTGTLWADQLQVFLRETPLDASQPAAANNAGSISSSIVPERISASGRVAIESTELTGKVNHLVVAIDHPQAGDASANPGAPLGPPAAPGSTGLFPQGNGPRRMYDIAGVTLEVDVAMNDRRPDVRAIRVDGGVVFQESAGADGTEPLRIVAEHLQVTGADTPNAQIEIRGAGGQNGLPLQVAEITAGGAKIQAPTLSVNRGASIATINSPGKLQMTVDRDMSGNPLPRPEPVNITWLESMKLEGHRITFLGDVHVEHSSGWLRTRRLVVQTTQVIGFDGASGQQKPQLEQLECWEGAVAEFEQRDISGVTSRQQIELQSLVANQTSGHLEGEGPGKIDSIHFAESPAAMLALPENPGGAAAPNLVQTEPKLRHLHIDFVRGVGGNLLKRTVNVQGDVEAVYGPVDSWDDRLTMSPGGNPGPDEVWITCQELGVTESPMAQVMNPPTRQVELTAVGRVVIEGQDPRRGIFTAHGHRATFDQSKGKFTLHGDGVTPATIEQQQYLGAPSSPQSAQRMEFNQHTGRVRIDGLHKGQFNRIR